MENLEIQPLTYRVYKVTNLENGNEYYVRFSEKGFICSCKAGLYRRNCKHIRAVKIRMLGADE